MKQTVKTTLLSSLALCLYLFGYANATTEDYIKQYKPIAVNEMQRVGIPASIKMAQAILESSSGRSTLARQSNNHFGIKCGGNWTGAEVYREDDDYENGLLVRSCFRAYDDPAESFYAHSDFLANPNSTRYKFLFKLDPYDYKAWAKGLRKAGYATDPKYPSKLINLIEKHELYLLDYGLIGDDSEPIVDNTNETIPKTNNPTRNDSSNPSKGSGSPVTPAYTKQPIDLDNGPRIRLTDGFHKVLEGERLGDIAAQYGMSIQELYMRNRIPHGREVKAGEQLAIQKYIHFGSLPELESRESVASKEEYLWEQTFTITSD